jgi:NADH dehydrogenase
MRTILVVGGGYAGFYTAWKLEKKLRRGEARVIVVDPRPYMTYQPFLPEVLAGSVEERHAAVSLRRHLRKTTVIAGRVTAIDHAYKTATVHPAVGPAFSVGYDIVVVTAGAATRRLAIPGIAEHAIGMKHVEEAVAIRDRLLTAFDQASTLEPGPLRRRLLTVTFVGGGFSGVEGFGELLSLATALQKKSYPELSPDELSFHLVEARDRILPEVSDRPGRWVVRSLEKRGARVHLNAELISARNGHVVLSTGEQFDSELIVWTVGNAANPMVRSHTDLPIDQNGMLVVRADLRVGTGTGPGAAPVTTRQCPTWPPSGPVPPQHPTPSPTPRTRCGRESCWPGTSSPRCAAASRSRTCITASERSPRSVSAAASSSTAAWSSRGFPPG